MRLTLPALCLTLLLPAAPAIAQELQSSDETQAGLSICAAADARPRTRSFNATYGEIMKRLADDEESRKLLQASQRAWIAFRDAECAFATDGSRDGSIYPMLVSQCLSGVTTGAHRTARRLPQLRGRRHVLPGAGGAVISGGSRFDPRKVPHLAAGACFRLAVEVEHQRRLGQQRRHPIDIVADQVLHHAVRMSCARCRAAGRRWRGYAARTARRRRQLRSSGRNCGRAARSR